MPTSHYGVAPREHVPAQPPRQREVAKPPKGHPLAAASVLRAGRPLKPRGVGAPPNPRRPKLVRDINGGTLLDLFAIFPDLPFPQYPGRTRRARDRRTAIGRRALRRGVR
jgi:hypothetical protein